MLEGCFKCYYSTPGSSGCWAEQGLHKFVTKYLASLCIFMSTCPSLQENINTGKYWFLSTMDNTTGEKLDRYIAEFSQAKLNICEHLCEQNFKQSNQETF